MTYVPAGRRAAPRSRRSPGRRGVVRTRPLRTHWLLLTTLLLQGYTQHMYGISDDSATASGGPADHVPPAVAHGGPVVDVFTLHGLLFLDPIPVTALWLGFLTLQTAMGLCAFRLDGERPGALWSLPLQQFVYRQLMYLVVVQSVVTALAGTRLRWQRMERYGSLSVPAAAPAAAAAPSLADSWTHEAQHLRERG